MAITAFTPPPADGSAPKPKAKAEPPDGSTAESGPAIRWDDRLRLGVEEIDAQHQALLGYCSELVEAVRRGHGKEAVAQVVGRLRDYTVSHFAAEERYMERIGYPNLDRHRAAHAALVRRVKEYQRQLYQKQSPSVAEVRTFLKDWLVLHILGEDLKIAAFLKSRAAAPSAAEPPAGPPPASSPE